MWICIALPYCISSVIQKVGGVVKRFDKLKPGSEQVVLRMTAEPEYSDCLIPAIRSGKFAAAYRFLTERLDRNKLRHARLWIANPPPQFKFRT
jgi:hypothetical protein